MHHLDFILARVQASAPFSSTAHWEKKSTENQISGIKWVLHGQRRRSIKILLGLKTTFKTHADLINRNQISERPKSYHGSTRRWASLSHIAPTASFSLFFKKCTHWKINLNQDFSINFAFARCLEYFCSESFSSGHFSHVRGLKNQPQIKISGIKWVLTATRCRSLDLHTPDCKFWIFHRMLQLKNQL